MAARGRKPKKAEVKNGKCYDCAKAYLMQSEKWNPIVAKCTVTGERWVASMTPECGVFDQREGEAEIHPMIFLNMK